MDEPLPLDTGAPNLRVRSAARSDVGLVRQGNEDSGYAAPELLLVADGMGGHAAGELASATAVATLAAIGATRDEAAALADLGECIRDIGDSIASTIDAEPDLTGMGTTLTGLLWLGDRFAVVHVGDSRAYRLRGGELAQLTHDHTYVQTLIDAGRLTEDEAAVHPRRSLLMRALDGMNEVDPDLFTVDARAGDRFLLCSDGLSGVVTAGEIAAHLRVGDPTGAVTRLVDLALERGAPDNVTVVVADIVDTVDVGAEPGGFGDAVRPVVVGAAGETRVRVRLPHVRFPDDMQPDPNRPDAPTRIPGPPTAEQPLVDADITVPAAELQRRRQAGAQVAADARRRRVAVLVKAGVAAVAVALVIVTAVTAARGFLAGQWYVAVNGSAGTGTVAVYNGVQGTLLGFDLFSVSEDSGLVVGALPLFDQELVSKGIPAASQADAQRIVAELRSRADECRQVPTPAGCPGAAP